VSDVFWIAANTNIPGARLAIVLRPLGNDRLQDELLGMKNAGIRTVVSMLEPWEADYLGLAEEQKVAEQIGINFLSYPIPDRATPENKSTFRHFVNGLVVRIRNGDAVGVHCRGSIGRSTIAIACTLSQLGWKPQTALKAIESARGCSVPDTEEQREWILRYEARP
jgi:protein-tyrosine phosphatase